MIKLLNFCMGCGSIFRGGELLLLHVVVAAAYCCCRICSSTETTEALIRLIMPVRKNKTMPKPGYSARTSYYTVINSKNKPSKEGHKKIAKRSVIAYYAETYMDYQV